MTIALAKWLAFCGTALGLGGYLAVALLAGGGRSRQLFLPGETTAGHYQIELACNACHTPLMGVKQNACLGCHQAELDLADDSHPRGKFTDPRNAGLLAKVDALRCITCHTEHRPHRTIEMGVTIAGDYCVHCHSGIAEERPTHAGLTFTTCSTAGCHNFHDNRNLHEEFLSGHLEAPPLLATRLMPQRGGGERDAALTAAQADAPPNAAVSAEVVEEWAATAHAKVGVNCMACHATDDAAGQGNLRGWIDRPDHNACRSCHTAQTGGFLGGKHGMRLAQDLGAMTPGEARLPMKAHAANRQLNCSSCHAAHRYDTVAAAAASCVSCHDDEHSQAYEGSPHHRLWLAEQSGAAPPGSGVSCATCHLPRLVHRGGEARIVVQHNQNDNLRPNEKMLRDVCMNCHGAGYAMDALADPAVIRGNFRARPSVRLKGLDMIRGRLEQMRLERANN